MTPVYAGDPTTPRLATREAGDETWAPILIAPGYEASSLGRVRSVERTITRTAGKTREGERCPLGHLLVDPNLIPSRAARGHVGCLACSRGAAEQRRHGQHPDEIQQRADRHYIHILEGSL